MSRLTHQNHDRDSVGLTYVYPVLSRRSQGLSIGINLNPNNACNWACLYCQVPNLIRGSAPTVDVELLKQELRSLLESQRSGALACQFELTPEEAPIRDIALSGNGEPTSCPNFAEVTRVIGMIAEEFDLLGRIKLVLITNGSLLDRPNVQEGLRQWGKMGGEAWFKLDRGTSKGIEQLNQTRIRLDRVERNLKICCGILPTFIQTCLITLDGAPPPKEDTEGYIRLLRSLVESEPTPAGVLLYGLARPSLQPQAQRIGCIPEEWALRLVEEIRALGLRVSFNP
jgi:wyosine [tRNA(Phe)-imidazoG37] synthetase (radical SAM superfamily)